MRGLVPVSSLQLACLVVSQLALVDVVPGTKTLPDNWPEISAHGNVIKTVENRMQKLFEQKPSKDEAEFVKNTRIFYKSCMNTNSIERRGNRPVARLIRTLGGWPVVGERSGWSASRAFNWLDLQAKFRLHGIADKIFIDTIVRPDQKDGSKHVLWVESPKSEHFDVVSRGRSDPSVIPYYRLMVEAAVRFGAKEQTAKEQMGEVLDFEAELAEGRLSAFSNLQRYTLTNWLKAELASFLRLVAGQSLRGSQIVVNPEFISRLFELIDRKEPRVVANYMIWQFVLDSMLSLGNEWVAVGEILGIGRFQVLVGRPRCDVCTELTMDKLAIASSSMYVKTHFKSDSRQAAAELVRNIKRELELSLFLASWMGASTKTEAREKLELMSASVGYPDELLNDTLVEEHHRGLQLNESEFFENKLRVSKWLEDFRFETLTITDYINDWRGDDQAIVVNAAYNRFANSIVSPAGMLQGAFFEVDRPNYLNYGGIGFVIGHEMTHGFDVLGRQYDARGKLKNWWDAETDSTFQKKSQCFVDQYGSQSVLDGPPVRVDGQLTLGENIADNGGLKKAFKAYNKWVKEHQEELLLPGLDLNQRQLFWVSAAHTWCAKVRPEYLRHKMQFDVHSPDKLRVNIPMTNSWEFSETFGCPLGSPMNPKKKCPEII